ncbi:MAG: O-antigen ligase family protein [Corynebacterium sp.]|uniref:O-antigen ligase family protein n=1 Tax=Corynebacterium sp. TaxID=1720 RepID=UPI0026E0B8F1|nr:O-antigen ligase family protein [Corynebacterium sp.]MDO5670282.1 O-antigen ligase family protein [Corynebacterium sp.]
MITYPTSRPRTPRRAENLGGALVLLPFSAYVLWWVLGVGDFIWIIAGLLIVASWLGTRGLRIPPVVILWVLFLAWAGVSLAMNDSPGRIVGSVYRLLLYTSAGILLVHTFNARRALPLHRVTGAMVWFLAGMTLAGYLAMAFPLAVIRTPMSWIMPRGLASNQLIDEMIVRRMAHWNPEAWIEQALRPVAPFLYANTWGNIYSLVLPLALLHLWLCWGTRYRWPTLLVILASTVPALSTLNRGMFIGLGVVLAWVLFQALLRGRIFLVVGGAVAGLAGAALWAVSPLGQALENRVETTDSTVDRAQLYRSTFEAVLQSPLFGYGSPRPAEEPWLPSLGTQGQFWTVLYSHGFIGAALFTGFLLGAFLLVIRRRDVVGSVLGGLILATLVETVFYGMMTGIMVSMVVVALALRPDTVISSGDRRGMCARPSATVRPPGRR